MRELRIKVPCGFEARVNEEALKDLEIYDAVRSFTTALNNNEPPDVRGTCEALLGVQGYRAFVAYEKKHEGFVRVDHASELINTVIQVLSDKKK